MPDFLVHIIQACIGACLVYCIRNDWDEKIGPIAIGRSKWTILALIFGGFLIGSNLPASAPVLYKLVITTLGMTLLGLILTLPHGQTLRGPHQDIPDNEDDPIFELAMFISGHKGGAGDVFGWQAWLWYNGIRYVLPCAFLGALLHSWVVGISGVLIVAFYWPIAFIPAVMQRFDTRFFGAGACGFWLFLGL